MSQVLANPKTNKKPVKQVVWRALVVPVSWTLSAAVAVLKSKRTDEGRPCRFILITHYGKRPYFVFGNDEYERENNEPFMCLVPDDELLAEWNQTRFDKP